MSAHVFISYVHEDNGQIDRLCEVLRAAGVEVWRDRDCIAPGLRWRDAIRHAIGQGAFFLACFSRNYWARQKSFMNTELGLAIEELTEFRRDQSWFVAVRLDDCDVPEWSIGAGETLKHLQHVDLFVDWADGMRRILAAVAPFASAELNARARFWVSAERRIDRALQLYDEWHTPAVHASRIQVSNFVEHRARTSALLPTLSAFERAQRVPDELTPYADHFFRVAHFFERWALLHGDGLLDQALAMRLLGSYANWYRARLLAPLAAADETNPDFIDLLALIERMFAAAELPARSGNAGDAP